MNLANPSALLWLGLVVPIVIFYILKIRLRRMPVSTVIFWQQIFDEKKPRSLWQKLRHLLSLLLQLFLILLMIMALTEPFFSWETQQSRRIVLVIDNSASMNTLDENPTRLDRAKEHAREIINSMSYRDEMAIVAAGTQPGIICGLTGHQRSLRDALNQLPATDGPTRLKDSISLARRLIAEQKADGKEVKIVVISDGCEKNLQESLDGADTQLLVVGKRTNNLGITRFQVRRTNNDPIGYEILAEVTNHSDEPIECRLEIELEGNPIDVIPIKLEANGKWNQVLDEKRSAEGGKLTAKLTPEDSLLLDNSVMAILPACEYQNVLLILPKPNLFLEKVLEANPLVRLKVESKPPQSIQAGTIQVYHHDVPKNIPPGPVFIIDPVNSTDFWTVGEKIQNPIVTQQDKESPFMTHLRLDNVMMPEARKLTFTPAAGKPKVLAGSVTGDPLFVELNLPEGRMLILTVNLDQGDLPLRTAFPIVVMNILNEFAGSRGQLREAMASGGTLEVPLPKNSESPYKLVRPDGSQSPLPLDVSQTTIGPLDQIGIWKIQRNDEKPIQELVCNMSNTEESDLRRSEGLTSVEDVSATGLSAGFLGRPIWFYLLGLSWLLLGLEWYLYQRGFIE